MTAVLTRQRRTVGHYSDRPEIPFAQQSIQHLAERAVDAQIAADEAREVAERKDREARSAAYTYCECLEARLKVRDLPPAA